MALARRNGWDLGRHRLVVTVREGGQPVAGALVFAGWYHDSSPDWANVRTDARGQVRLLVDWVPVRVSATAPGRRAAEDLEPTRGVRGTVVDERGVPVVGAGVLLQSLTDRAVQRWATSDDLGEFALDEVPGGPFLVSATEPASLDDARGRGRAVSGVSAGRARRRSRPPSRAPRR